MEMSGTELFSNLPEDDEDKGMDELFQSMVENKEIKKWELPIGVDASKIEFEEYK